MIKPLQILVFLIVLIPVSDFGQSWQSISKVDTYQTTPIRQFTINPYTNDIWLVNDTKVAVIENNGTIFQFTETDLGTLWTGDNLSFEFSENNIYYARDIFGLYSFNNYNSQLLDNSIVDYLSMSSSYDTLYFTIASSGGFKKFILGSLYSFNQNYDEIYAKNNNFYGVSNNGYIYSFNQSSLVSTSLIGDPQYIIGQINHLKFSRQTDSLFVASDKGVSIAFNYDFLDTITPNNTFNMPSPNVLELEFDHQDSLWAVFGDVSNNPIAIAKLSGSSWVNKIDNTNSPIDFANFYGLEIDTMGNLWVADANHIHTLLGANSPDWLNTIELIVEEDFVIAPNPSKGLFTINYSGNSIPQTITITDIAGKLVKKIPFAYTMDLELQPGNYFISFSDEKDFIHTKRIIIE